MKKILVIEDNANHLEDAKKFFASKEVEVIYARTLREARKHLPHRHPLTGEVMSGKVNGVISDIFFPLSDDETWNNPEPIGVRVAMACREYKMPCVLNTAGYHHGSQYEWIHQMSLEFPGFPPIIDASNDYHKEAEVKNWEEAYGELMGIINPPPQPEQA